MSYLIALSIAVLKGRITAIADWLDGNIGFIMLAVVVASIVWYFIVTGRP